MAQDATGTPTPLGIPKYDPANDAPSGLGFNAAMDSIDTLIAALKAKTVSNYTPAWTASSVNPSLGNGTISGVYYRVGPLVVVNITLLMGSTTTFGTGGWRFSYPSGAASNTTVSIGAGWAVDSSVPASHAMHVRGETDWMTVMTAGNPASLADSATPFTWAQNDVLRLTLSYLSTE